MVHWQSQYFEAKRGMKFIAKHAQGCQANCVTSNHPGNSSFEAVDIRIQEVFQYLSSHT